jgi:hypothetical protein
MTRVPLKILVYLISLSTFIFITGCAPQEFIRKESYLSDEDIKALLERISLTEEPFLASVKVSLFKKGENAGVYTGSLLYRDSSKFIIRLYSPFGHAYMEIVFNKGRTYIYMPSRDTVFLGDLPFTTLLPKGLSSIEKTTVEREDVLRVFLYDENKVLRAIYKFNSHSMKLNSIVFYPEGSDKDEYWIEIKDLENGIPLDFTIHVLYSEINIKLLNIKKAKNTIKGGFDIPDAKYYLPLSKFRF